MDVLTAEERTACMRAVRSKGTTPEMRVRRTAHHLGYRYALHKKTLPGSPDLVFPARKKVIFVHGCFWHQHNCKAGLKVPVQNAGYWTRKRIRNVERDRSNTALLSEQGWEVLVVWECKTKDTPKLAEGLKRFLDK